MSQNTLPLDERVSTALAKNPYVPGRQLRFETSDGRVTLRGEVRCYFHKQMAQEMIRVVDGVQEIDNRITVSD